MDPEASRPELTEAQEDYLKQILLLGEGVPAVSTQRLADRMGVRPASVTGMVQRLAQLGLVRHAPYRGVQLTDAGRRVALEIVRHHRLLETWLARALDYRWDEVHAEAERLEHVISETFEARIAELLDHPTHDPHGDPIPDARLVMPPVAPTVALTRAEPGRELAVARVTAQQPEALARLASLGLTPGCRLRVVSRRAEGGVGVEVGGRRVVVPEDEASTVQVKPALAGWDDGEGST